MEKELKKFWLASLAFAVVYVILFANFTAPYRPFPGEDLRFMYKPFEWLHQPVFTLAVQGAQTVLGYFGASAPNALLTLLLVSNAVCSILVGALIFLFTQRLLFAVTGMFLFALSPWPTNYLLMASYTPFATVWCLASMGLLFLSTKFQQPQKQIFQTVYISPILIYCLMAGITTGYFALSSPSAPIFITLFVIVMFYRFRKISANQRFGLILSYLIAATLTLLPFGAKTGWDLFVHYNSNIWQNNYSGVQAVLSSPPGPPSFSFFRILAEYDPFLAGISLLTLLIVLARSFRVPLGENHLALIFLTMAHPLLIDLLPFTKLARTHFPSYPLLICLTLVNIQILFPHSLRKLAPLVSVGFVLIVSFHHIPFNNKMIEAKQMAADKIVEWSDKTSFYLLKADPHAKTFQHNIPIPFVRVAHPKEIRSKRKPFSGLLIGPTGPDSGKSILGASMLKNFEIDLNKLEKPSGTKEFTLPYYAYFPSFLWEEEISQAYYFSGQSANYKAKEHQLTLWIWPN